MVQGEVGIPLEFKLRMGPHLQMRWDTRGSCRIGAGNWAFILSCDRDLWAPLSCLKGVKSSRVLSGNSGMLSRRCRRKGPHVALTGESRGLSRVAAGGLGNGM